MVLDGYHTPSSFVNPPRVMRAMDKVVSTIILVSVSIALAVVFSTYYAGFVKLFITYKEISFGFKSEL